MVTKMADCWLLVQERNLFVFSYAFQLEERPLTMETKLGCEMVRVVPEEKSVMLVMSSRVNPP